MKAVFLSDAHLYDSKDEGYQKLLAFLHAMEADVDHLFIVGDFFDFWFCTRDRVYPGFRVIIDALLRLRERGVTISLFEGNHDFFLDAFFGRYGMAVYPEDAVVHLEGKKLYVAHGDLVDVSNRRYLCLRKLLRSRIFYVLQAMLPCPLLWKISEISSRVSKEHLAAPSGGIADRMEAFSRERFSEGFDAVILGHCHRPLMRQTSMNGAMKTFVTLGDWISHFSYLLYDDGKFSLRHYGRSPEREMSPVSGVSTKNPGG